MDSQRVGRSVAEVGESQVVETGARLGYAMNGVMHLVIALISVQLAFGGSGESADTSGALQKLAGNGFGMVLLWVILIGYALLALWQLSEAIRPHGGERELKDRGRGVAKSLAYAALALTSFTFATGGSSSSKEQTADFTARLMGAPFGRILVAVVGLIILGVAGYHVYKGWTKRFLEDLVDHPGRMAVRAGQYGYVAKGVALAVVGLLFLLAALRGQAERSTGLDGALRSLLERPFGPYLLTLVALGFVAYGVYSFARARYARV